jgi:hypothetical protein
MARKYYFPDPNDRSANAPSVIVSKPQVIGLWNQANPTDKMERVTEKVQEWFINQSKAYKWTSAHFSGNECQLVSAIKKHDLPE